MKKLLLLGGSQYLLPVIETAHTLNCHVITCDYLPDNVAHKYADEYHNVSIVDQNAVLDLARRLKIDGVMSFACDPGVVTAAYVAEQLGLPSCGPYESVRILQDKGRFRSFLAEHGFNVPTAKCYQDPEDAERDADLFRWPVIVKPTDSAGSKGVTRVDDPAGLRASAQNALAYSRSGRFVVEDYLEQMGCSSDSDCFSVDGRMAFLSFSAQRFDPRAGNPYTPAAFSWPATICAEHQAELASELQRLIELLHMGTSIYNVETRECTDGKAYIMEVSPRGGGNRLAEMLRYATGVDLIKNAVLAALGERVDVSQQPYDGHWAEVILHSREPGVYKGLWLAEEIMPHRVEQDIWVKPGDRVGGFVGANEAIGTLVLRFDSRCQLLEALACQEKWLRVDVRESPQISRGGILSKSK